MNAAIIVLKGDEQVFYLHGEPVNKSSLFEIGSVSKPLFALLASQLVIEQEWSLDMPVAQLLDKQYRHHNYSLQQLLTHRSGLPRLPSNLTPINMDDPYALFGDDALAEALSASNSAPGPFEYSNYGYGLLGWLMAENFKVSQSHMVEKYLFDNLEMEHAQLAITGSKQTKLRGQDYYGDKVPNWHFDSLVGAGGVLASPQDMANWISAYWLSPKNIPTLVKSMGNSLTLLNDDMAYAWRVGQQGQYFHGGRTAGFSTMVIFDPKKQVAVITMVAGERDADKIAMTLFEQLQNKDK